VGERRRMDKSRVQEEIRDALERIAARLDEIGRDYTREWASSGSSSAPSVPAGTKPKVSVTSSKNTSRGITTPPAPPPRRCRTKRPSFFLLGVLCGRVFL
jgi:hypothetical protein